jgi:uncharacterized protein YfaS (alpha-2-macroglobulin family)
MISRSTARLAAVALFAGCVVALIVAAAGTPRQAQWKQVDEAINKGLPKTAVERLGPIIEGAMKERNYPEAIKAIALRISLEGNIQGNKPEEKIVRMREEVAKAPVEMRPAMDAVLAHWYWHYFQHNRWRFLNRTATGEAPGDDMTTWDLPRIFAEIDKQFTKALAAEKELKATPVAAYDQLLEKGTLPDSYRPTLYDFIAFEALTFYTSPEQAGARAEDAFELEASSPIFAPVDEFLKWEPKTTDEGSRTIKAIRLYQALLNSHKGDDDKSAFLDADLQRLQFGFNTAVGDEKNERYKDALKRFADEQKGHELSATARSLWAGVLQQENDLVEARQVALEGEKAYPKSVGGMMCHNVVVAIEAPEVQVTTERVWNNPWPTVRVQYRNVKKIYFRAVRWDFINQLNAANWRPENLDQKQRNQLLARKPDREWSADLPATDDYHERVQEISGPKDLPAGFYFLVASHDANFGGTLSPVSFTDFWVSDLALVMRNRLGELFIEGFVLNANSGEPIDRADVQLWVRNQQGRFNPGPIVKSDANGLFSIRGQPGIGWLVVASHNGHQLATGNDYYVYQQNEDRRPHLRTVFFTDRSLYRPGQTVQFKGIVVRFDQEKDDYRTVPNHAMAVIFSDPNGKEIARQKVQSNDYGSFSGSFTAPRDRLMGHMMIRAEGEAQGTAGFNVEEYKRPKFQVTLEPPKEAPKLDAPVELVGKATAYTGAAIGGAQVRYRVVRQVRYPPWWYMGYGWWMSQRTEAQEIAHGTAITNPDGSFPIQFVAKPDRSVSEKEEPTFHFSITADVTDTTGETRSAERGVNVGYTALQANLSADGWQAEGQEVKVNVVTQTHDGEGQAAKTMVKVYRLKQPEKVERAHFQGKWRPQPVSRRGGKKIETKPKPEPDPSDPNTWELADEVASQGVDTDEKGKGSASFKLEAGIYRVMLETKDRFGKEVTARLPVQVLNPSAKALGVKVPNVVAAPKWTLEPGQEFSALWGSGYDKARAFIEIEHRNQPKQAFWTEPGRTQQQFKQSVTEAMRGGFTLRVTMVRENRAYLTSHHVDVPWTNKQLSVKWEHFVSKLEPGKKETWTAVVSGPDAKRAVAEMVAALYDESLDAYLAQHWQSGFGVFRDDNSKVQEQFENMVRQFQHLRGQWPNRWKEVNATYRHFPIQITANLWGYQYFGRRGFGGGGGGNAPGPAGGDFDGAVAPTAALAAPKSALGDAKEDMRDMAEALTTNRADKRPSEPAAPPPGGAPPSPDLSQVSARKNLNETAFFFPHLVSNNEGEVKLEFTMPEALTKWKFLGFAHDRELRAGLLEDHAVTAKDLMVQPNPPRFVREGDGLEFTVKVSNQSEQRQVGSARLTFADLRGGKSVDQALALAATDQPFDIPPKESKTLSWRIQVPDGMGPLTYKAVGSTSQLSDGEEGYLPVLSRRILVTESLPLPIRGPATKEFTFEHLKNAGKSDTLQSQSLTVQMTSNPAWYAVMALPYLMEYPYECSEQTFNRLYANALARHVATSDPKVRKVFDQWKGTAALDSPLEKNQDLKAVTLEETPWLRQAQKESEARKNVGILFDDNRLDNEVGRTLQKLAEMQLPDGAWPWFPGGPANDYITLYITTGFGRLRHMGVAVGVGPAIKSLNRLDGWIVRVYEEILRHGKPDENHLSPTIALYLYGRSFFLADTPIPDGSKKAVDYFLGQAKKYWLELANRQSQAHLAVALKRFGDKSTAEGIMKSIKERSVTNEEMGMFWRETELSFFWFRAPIETQAMMVEAFGEVMDDSQAVEECKVWLLKQKQTQDWKTTKATADAVYALLLRGTDLLKSEALVELTLGDVPIKPEKAEAGTGFYEQRFVRAEVKPEFGQVTVKKTDPGVAWGSVHWQYLEDMAKVPAYEGTPLKLTKSLYTKQHTKKGPVLEAVKGPVQVGDELVVRIELRVDRDMEYIHLKDYRGSGTEPTNVLSRYKYQDGLGYYESTRDTASHFFIDYLPKGSYVFEYSVRVQHRGQYQTGVAEIQCMYASEFNSHSASVPLEVK